MNVCVHYFHFALNLLLILIFFIYGVTFNKFQLILSLAVYSKFKVCMLYRIWNGHVDKDDEKLSCNHDYSHKGVRIFWRSSFMKWRGISLGSEFPEPGSLHFFPFSYIFYPKTHSAVSCLKMKVWLRNWYYTLIST